MDKKIKIYHIDWNDDLHLDYERNIIKRLYNNDYGKFILIDNFLLIIWEKWGKEYFYSKDNNNYYFINDNNTFNLDNDVSIIYLIDISNSNKYILNNVLQKIYYIDDLKLYGNFNIDDIYLTITYNNNIYKYVYFNNKYYSKDIFDKKYNIINIKEEKEKKYILEKNSNICYEDNNIFKKHNYTIYKNKLKICNNIYNMIHKNNYIKYNYTENDNTENDILKIDMSKYIIIINIDDIYKIINFIEFYIYFNIKYIVYDDIINKENNYIFLNINFIYYNSIDNIEEIITTYKNNDIYINSIDKKIKSDNIKYYNNYLINEYSILKECNVDIKSIWYNLNKNKLDKYEYLLKNYSNKDKIPKIMHFIWLGNNKLPDIYLEYIESWIKNHKDWIFCFWNDDNIPILINQKYYDETDVYAMKADLLRYELLYIFGGVYVDCDFLCIKNIEDIIKEYNGFSGYESEKYIAIGLMGFVQYDNILYNIIKNISYNINTSTSQYIPQLSGPIYFTEIWNIYKTDLHYSFPIEYFYSYTYQDKINNIGYNINNNNYAIHMWGHSWDINKIKNKDNKKDKDNNYYLVNYYLVNYYLVNYYLSNIIIDVDNNNNNINKIKYVDIEKYLKNKIFFKVNQNTKKKKIVNIMGLFFTGGIERYLYYIDKYGNHELYNYYLLYISNDKYVYDIKNINMISFNWNNEHLYNLLTYIRPDLIIDHYSIYINDNIYKNMNQNNILYFIHSAICYKNDIKKILINKCINLYKELNKHPSWNNIIKNYYLTLGTELNSKKINTDRYIINKKINISIIGRICEEKIGIDFLKKICDTSNTIYNDIEIHIYGEKDIVFNNEYTKKFDEIINKSKIIYHNFIDPLKMEDIYLNTNVLIIPSTYETGSFTCIEAFSYGIPVIARNVYGLKYMIKNNITGYLCNSDDEIIDKIINIKNDKIINNIDIIKEESLNYNIVNKIKDLEFIISENISNKNIVIITSVINCVDKPLSYYHKRSIFSVDERYLHTLKSINTIKKYIPNVDILLCECSDLSNYSEINESIKNNVDYFYNFYENKEIRNKVDSELKGLGEASLLLEGLNILMNKEIITENKYKYIFKLSGRYFLNNNFNYKIFDNDFNIFTNWDNSKSSYCTIFYKIHSKYINYYKKILLNSIEDLYNKNSIEICMYKYFSEDIKIIDKLNVSGYLATEGYLYTV